MNKKELIKNLYKILLLYEDMTNNNDWVTEKDYIQYLSNLYVYLIGLNDDKLCCYIKGLRDLAGNVTHHTVKSIVFSLIDYVEKGDMLLCP